MLFAHERFLWVAWIKKNIIGENVYLDIRFYLLMELDLETVG